MTWGLGNIGSDSVTTLAKDLRVLLMGRRHEYHIDPEDYTIEQVAVKARKFLFEDKFAALAVKPKAELSFYVGGYSSNSSSPECWVIKIQSGSNSSPAPERLGDPGGGLYWGGQPEAISRLVLGISSNHIKALENAGLTPDQAKAASASLTRNLQVQLLHGAMPVRDAVDLADFLVETTKRFVRFLPGADTVRGDTDIAVVTKHEGFKWVRRKHYFDSVLNPPEVSYGARYPTEKGKPGHSAGTGAPT